MTYSEFVRRMIALKGRPEADIRALLAEFNNDSSTTDRDRDLALIALEACRCELLARQRSTH